MAKFRVMIEITDEAEKVTMRWEQSALAKELAAFQLLGRAFEVAQRDEGSPFPAALAAFFKGAMIQKADVIESLERGARD